MNTLRRIVEKIFKLEKEECASCRTLSFLLEQERYDKRLILQSLIKTDSEPVEAEPQIDYSKVVRKNPSWSVTKQMLEARDRELAAGRKVDAKIIAEQSKELEKLEEQVLG